MKLPRTPAQQLTEKKKKKTTQGAVTEVVFSTSFKRESVKKKKKHMTGMFKFHCAACETYYSLLQPSAPNTI